MLGAQLRTLLGPPRPLSLPPDALLRPGGVLGRPLSGPGLLAGGLPLPLRGELRGGRRAGSTLRRQLRGHRVAAGLPVVDGLLDGEFVLEVRLVELGARGAQLRLQRGRLRASSLEALLRGPKRLFTNKNLLPEG
jgi:hypothetical protein